MKPTSQAHARVSSIACVGAETFSICARKLQSCWSLWGNGAWPPAWLPEPLLPMRGSVGRFSAASCQLESSRERCDNAQEFFGDLPVSDRMGRDRTGVGYKGPSHLTSRSLALPSSSCGGTSRYRFVECPRRLWPLRHFWFPVTGSGTRLHGFFKAS